MVQVNHFQKHLFLHQLNHNMTITMKTASAEHGKNMGRTPMFYASSFHGNFMNNLLSYCGLIDAKTRASDKDSPVPQVELFCFLFFGKIEDTKKTF